MVLNNVEIAYNQLKDILRYKKYLSIAIMIGIGFFFLYAIATQMLYITSNNSAFTFLLLPNWPELIFRERGFPNYESIILILLGPLRFEIPIPNLLFAILISVLASLNLTVSIFSMTAPTACRINPVQGLASSLPAFLTGFACCSPVFLMGLGIFSASTTLLFIEILPYFVPLSIIGLILSLFYSTWKLSSKIQKSDIKIDKIVGKDILGI